jgi:hypothetical protein
MEKLIYHSQSYKHRKQVRFLIILDLKLSELFNSKAYYYRKAPLPLIIQPNCEVIERLKVKERDHRLFQAIGGN